MGNKIKIIIKPEEVRDILMEYVKNKYNLKGSKSHLGIVGVRGEVISFDVEIEDAEIKKDLKDVDLND